MKYPLLRCLPLLLLATSGAPSVRFAYAGEPLPVQNRAMLEQSISAAMPAGVEARVIVIDRVVATN